jgi:hypothetical protein
MDSTWVLGQHNVKIKHKWCHSLFLSSSLSSVVTDVRRRSNSIHNAASETARSLPEARVTRVCSFEPWIRSGLSEKELVRLEMESESTQKKVTV